MTTKKKTATEQVDTPVVSPLLDASGNPSAVAAGQLIESAWGNSVAGRVVYRYPNLAALQAAAPGQGTLAVTTDTGVVWIRLGGNWCPTAVGNRVVFRIVGGGAGQTIPASTDTGLSYTTELADIYGVVSAGVFTVPAGWAGRWMFEWQVGFPGPSSGARFAWLQTSSGDKFSYQSLMTVDSAVDVHISGAASVPLAVGAGVQVTVRHSNPTAMAINGSTVNYFQGYYIGPN